MRTSLGKSSPTDATHGRTHVGASCAGSVGDGANQAALIASRQISAALFGPTPDRTLAIEYWDGTIEPASTPAPFTFVLRAPSSYRAILLPPSELAFVHAYVQDEVDVLGDMEAAVAAAQDAAHRLRTPQTLLRLASMTARLPSRAKRRADRPRDGEAHLLGRRHSPGRDAAAIRHHYDAGNDFYALWLDSRMVYSCGYFETEEDDIETAQRAKLDYICRKLRLQAGERLLDIGCGWGGLIIYAAEHYGVEALGITLSPEQSRLANERIAAAGLAGRCRVEVRDYRDLPWSPQFDKIASVGMIEHVGRVRLPDYFQSIWRCLRPGGLLFNQGIVLSTIGQSQEPGWWERVVWREGQFIQRYVFPDGELVPFADVIGTAESSGFETRDVECLREHYVLTLRQWLRRLEAQHDAAVASVGEETYRVWRLYLAGSAHEFRTGAISLMQTVFSKAVDGRCTLPMTRRDLYA